MSARTALAARRARFSPAALLVTGILLATLTDAVAGTVLSFGRREVMGDTHATPDEFAWLETGYTALKLVGFMVAPWLLQRFGPRNVLVAAVIAMGLACGLAAVNVRLDVLVALRVIQGFAGGTLLVTGQAMLFRSWPLARQPFLQALFAMAAVVAPATLAPAFQGWLLDSQSWAWIFASVVPVAMLAAALLLLADAPGPARAPGRPFDWIGFVLLSVSLACLSFVFSQGSRWDWFDAPRITASSAIGAGAAIAFLSRQVLAGPAGLVDFGVFRSNDFSFAFIVSFVAGAALFGSSFLIPSFAVGVLGFTATAAGQLLLPSSVLFVVALLVSAYLMQVLRVPPIATVPFGIVIIMLAMWMLSGSTGESGAGDMTAAILLRGLGLGFLFLSITLVAFATLDDTRLASGIALFNTGRQLGGLAGVAGLQTLVDHQVAGNLAVLGARLTAGSPLVDERIAATTGLLVARGMDAATAGRAAAALLGRAVTGQSTVLAFDTAFSAVALLFVLAAPAMLAVKFGLSRRRQSTGGAA